MTGLSRRVPLDRKSHYERTVWPCCVEVRGYHAELRRTFEQFTQLMGGKVDKNYDKLQYATLKLLGVL